MADALTRSAEIREAMAETLAPFVTELVPTLTAEVIKTKPARAQELGVDGLKPLKAEITSLAADGHRLALEGLARGATWIDLEVDPRRTQMAREIATHGREHDSMSLHHGIVDMFDPVQQALVKAGFHDGATHMGAKIAWTHREELARHVRDLKVEYVSTTREWMQAFEACEDAKRRKREDAATDLWDQA